MVELYIAGTFLGALLVLALGFWIHSRRKRHSSIIKSRYPAPDAGDGSAPDGRRLDQPLVWMVLFFAILAVVGGTVIAVLTDAPLIGDSPATVVAVVFGTLLTGFVIYNVYTVARTRGHSSALSIFESLAVLGVLAIIGVTALLILG